mgnify:CR=1 FL=1
MSVPVHLLDTLRSIYYYSLSERASSTSEDDVFSDFCPELAGSTVCYSLATLLLLNYVYSLREDVSTSREMSADEKSVDVWTHCTAAEQVVLMRGNTCGCSVGYE